MAALSAHVSPKSTRGLDPASLNARSSSRIGERLHGHAVVRLAHARARRRPRTPTPAPKPAAPAAPPAGAPRAIEQFSAWCPPTYSNATVCSSGADTDARIVTPAPPITARSAPGRASTRVDRTRPIPPSRQPRAVQRQRAVGDPRRHRPAHAHAPERDVEPRARRLGEADGVQPDPALGVLGAPVVADHPAPAGHLGAAAAGLDPAGEHGVRQRALELGARERGAVHPRAREVAQAGLLARRLELPGGRAPGRRGATPRSARPRAATARAATA